MGKAVVLLRIENVISENVESRDEIQVRVVDLYEANRDGVYRALLAAGLDSGKAQEMTQEAFLRFYVVLREGGLVENARAWVYRVAHNLAVDSMTREAREMAIPDSMIQTLSSNGSGAEKDLIDQEWRERFQAAVARLSTQQRMCLELRAQGLRYQEIAEVLQIRPSTVGEFLRRAVRQLRKFYPCEQRP
jgi:RNA polymerase sigma-70 factor (ECF subfamily)